MKGRRQWPAAGCQLPAGRLSAGQSGWEERFGSPGFSVPCCCFCHLMLARNPVLKGQGTQLEAVAEFGSAFS
jgi:hypothetical protein